MFILFILLSANRMFHRTSNDFFIIKETHRNAALFLVRASFN